MGALKNASDSQFRHSGLAIRLASPDTSRRGRSALRLQAAAAGNLPWERPMTDHRDFIDGPCGVRYRPDRNRDCRRRDVVGRRTDGVRPPSLHDRAGGVGAGLRGSDARECIRRQRGGGVAHAGHRQAERDRDPSVGKSAQPDPGRRSRTGADRHAHRSQPGVQSWDLVGTRPERWRSGSERWRCCNAWARPIRCSGRFTCGTYGTGRSIRQRAACSPGVAAATELVAE